jgi:integrase
VPSYKSAKPSKPVSSSDMKRYLNTNCEPWVKSLLVFLWIYGVRINEALKLQVEDFFSDGEYLYVRCPPSKNPSEPNRVLPVSLDTPFVKFLWDFVKFQKMGTVWLDASKTTFWRRMKKIDPELCSHRFRHNRATQIALTRAHPYELQSWLGHSDIRTASNYIHASGVFAEDLGKRLIIR